MDSFEYIERNIAFSIEQKEMVYGIVLGGVPSIFLGMWSSLYSVIMLIAFAFTKRKLFLWAFLVSMLMFLSNIMMEMLTEYQSIIVKQISPFYPMRI